jgi:hypothetical protein
MRKTRTTLVHIAIIITIVGLSVILQSRKENNEADDKPTPTPEGILVKKLPAEADILFVSIRYVLKEAECLDRAYKVKENFLNDADCIQRIYDSELDNIASPRQLYSLDIDAGEVRQLTNIEYDFSSSKIINSTMIMAIGSPFTLGEGSSGEADIYLINLERESIECLTCELNLSSINNPDYSPDNGKIIFSAQKDGVFHNCLFTLDLDKNLIQLTDEEEYMEFDCY